MFWGATSFNQPLNNWNVSNVTDMEDMFENASSFNQPLNNFVERATHIFIYGAESYDEESDSE